MGIKDSGFIDHQDSQPTVSEELITLLRQRVESKYYDQPEVIECIARAILISRGIYPKRVSWS
jgi:hypothetical protein